MADDGTWKARLLARGFKRAGTWHMADGATSPTLKVVEAMSKAAGVYAYLLNDRVHYVGSAQRGLAARVRHYERSATMATAMRVRESIHKALQEGGTVEMLIAFPEDLEWQGLPVNGIAGLEDGLIRTIRPRWNMRGTGGKAKVATTLVLDQL